MKFKLPPPFPLVEKFLPKIKDGVALDIGSGSGRNSIFLAKNNFKVEAFDISGEAIEGIKKLAAELNLKVNFKRADVLNFKFGVQKYDLVLGIQSLIWMKKADFIKIIKKIKKSLKINGVAIIIGFTVEDKSYLNLKSLKEPVAKNTFYSNSEKRYWQFLDNQELKNTSAKILIFCITKKK